MLRARFLCAAWVLATAAEAAPASAADLRFDAPAECGVTEANLEAQIARLVGQPLAAMGGGEFAVRVRRAGRAWRLVLSAKPDPAQSSERPTARQIGGATCVEVTDAAAVAIALAVAGRAPAGADAQSWEPLPAEPAEASPTAPPVQPARALESTNASDAATSTDDSSSAMRLGFGIGAMFDSAALPAFGAGAAIHALAELSALRVELFGALFLPQETKLSDGRGGKFDLALAGIRACGRSDFGAVAIAGCAGFEAGQLEGRGSHVRTERSRGTTWLAATGEAAVIWTVVPKLALLLRTGVVGPLSRPTFVLDGVQAVHRAGAVTFRAFLGAELYL